MSYWDDMRDNARRWVRDQTASETVIDETGQKRKLIDETPQRKMDRLSEALPRLSAEERQDQLNHLKAYTDYYYKGHQREETIPLEKQKSLDKLDKEGNGNKRHHSSPRLMPNPSTRRWSAPRLLRRNQKQPG